ncbi:cysteine desulfurase [Micrococcales bacterium 31B]|nr:cysteine desulfurase [Micrococcales bacterium 31B]
MTGRTGGGETGRTGGGVTGRTGGGAGAPAGPLYLDHAATAPPSRAVLEAMWPYLTAEFGNPSSVHEVGRRAAVALADARERVAAHLGFRASEVIFTGGGTESDNLALQGLIDPADPARARLVTTLAEHEAVLDTARALAARGASVELLPVRRDGTLDPAALAAALGARTRLVSVMHANNEIGSVNDIAALAEIAHEHGALLHTDAVQSAPALDLDGLGADAVAISGHKLGTPKGIGALAVRARARVSPVLHGGGQERGRRSGTVNVAGAVGLVAALDLAAAHRPDPSLRDHFIADALAACLAAGARLTGAGGGAAESAPGESAPGESGPGESGPGESGPGGRLPTHASFIFPGLSGEAILLELERRGVIASSGSACAAGRDEPSHVLLACGVSTDEARSAVRFSWGSDTTRADLARAAAALGEALAAVGA